MLFNFFIGIVGNPPRADNDFSQIDPDINTCTERADKSAPTDAVIILLMCILYAFP